MQIVVLDGYALNPGDLSWAELERLGGVQIYVRTPPEEIVARSAGAEALLTNKTPLSRQTLAQLPALRYVGVLATGYDVVDLSAAGERGVVVTNVPRYATGSVAQMVFAHLLNLAWHAADHGRTVVAGRWSNCPDFCYWDWPLIDLNGLMLGLIGLGQIGQAVAKLGAAFGMKVLAYDPAYSLSLRERDGVRAAGPESHVELDELQRESDVISLHCPLTPETDKLINAERLALLKPTAFLINTSRGGLIDEPALAEALNAGRLAGAGLDVLTEEPPPPDHPLLRARNCCITPHIAWASKRARQRLLDEAVENLRAFLAGAPRNVVTA
ncbi:MAG: D-2-hydroxyacid dehydrogenase [Pirellulales bacterium]|nr:D-2-hydroxyacid dehydrogenase [Pirellulales bacterium]